MDRLKVPVCILILFLIATCSEREIIPLSGTWEMTAYRINHEDEPDEIRVLWEFGEDGSFEQRIVYTTHETTESGEWNLSDDKQWLTISYTRNKTEVEWKIIHLDDSLIQLEHTIPGFFVERSFKKQ